MGKSCTAGRWHIDRRNALLFGEYGLAGVLEQARVSGRGVQEMARKSPGAGITAMQMLMALRAGVLVTVEKQQAEAAKTLYDLVQAASARQISPRCWRRCTPKPKSRLCYKRLVELTVQEVLGGARPECAYEVDKIPTGCPSRGGC